MGPGLLITTYIKSGSNPNNMAHLYVYFIYAFSGERRSPAEYLIFKLLDWTLPSNPLYSLFFLPISVLCKRALHIRLLFFRKERKN